MPIGASIEMLVLSFGLTANVQEERELDRIRIENLNEKLAESNAFLQKSYDDIKESEAYRTRFFQNTSHELRTPLNGILGYLSLCLRNHPTMPEELTSTLQKIYRLSDSLKHQIDDILNLAKMRRGGFEPCASHINLGDLLKKCEHLSEGLCINQPNAEFKARLLIDQGLSSEFICDGRIIETILRNLIGNAIKFSDPDRSNMVDIILHRSLGKLTIVVSDKGIGIADEHKEKIFEEFYQVASEARRRYEGSGLGLDTAR